MKRNDCQILNQKTIGSFQAFNPLGAGYNSFCNFTPVCPCERLSADGKADQLNIKHLTTFGLKAHNDIAYGEAIGL